MRAKRGPAVMLTGAAVMLGVGLTGCTDDSGAIDQKGHNGYDLKACTQVAALANDVSHGAVTPSQAGAEAERIAGESDRAGDVAVRRAGVRLRTAYRAGDARATGEAFAGFAAACAW